MKKKSIKHVKRLVYGKRGTKIDCKFCCAICGTVYEKGWRYKIDEDTALYLCTGCKEKVRPQITVKAIYSAPFEINRRNH